MLMPTGLIKRQSYLGHCNCETVGNMWCELIFLFIICTSSDAVDKTCYPHLDCFQTGPPWTTKTRPIPLPDPPEFLRVNCFYYTRPNIKRRHFIDTWPTVDLRGTHFDKHKMTFFIIHGYATSGTDQWVSDLAEALLNKTDSQVMVANWGFYTKKVNYLQSVANMRVAARQFTNLFMYLIDHKGLDPNRLHIIGHSLGAHLGGYIGKAIPGVFQITGLDPANPMFANESPKVTLTKDDATFVMIVHSFARPLLPELGVGMMEDIGDVDFYINSGMGQPGCKFPKAVDVPKVNSVAELLAVPADLFTFISACPHGLSHVFFTEAIRQEKCIFWGHKATMSTFLRGISNRKSNGFFSRYLGSPTPCNLTNCSPMNLDTYFWPARGSFIVITRGSAPYCMYEDGIVTDEDQKGFTYKIQKAAINYWQKRY